MNRYPSIQDVCPDTTTLGELCAQVIMECYLRGVSHAGQQAYILDKVLKDYVFDNGEDIIAHT